MTSILVFLIFSFNTAGNLLLKKGAGQKRVMLNSFTLIGYALFCCVVGMSRYYLQSHTLKSMAMVMAVNYVLTYVFSCIVFKESVSASGVAGMSIIFSGIIVFNL